MQTNLLRDRRHDFLARERAAAALDHRELAVDLVRAVHVDRQLVHGVEIEDLDAQRLQPPGRFLGARHGAAHAMPDLAELGDEEVGGRAGAHADHAAGRHVRDRGRGGGALHVVLGHARMVSGER